MYCDGQVFYLSDVREAFSSAAVSGTSHKEQYVLVNFYLIKSWQILDTSFQSC